MLINGAFVSSLIEGICLNAPGLPARHSEVFCKRFAPEAAAFVYLAKSNWPAGALEVWSCLNMALSAGALVYINHFHAQPMLGLRWGVTFMIYYQAMQMGANISVKYLIGSRLPEATEYAFNAVFNGASTGLITGAISFWFAYRQTLQNKPLVLVAASAGAAVPFTCFYFLCADSGNMDSFEKILVVARAVAVAVAVAVAGAVAVAVAGAVAVAVAVAGAGAGAGVVAEPKPKPEPEP